MLLWLNQEFDNADGEECSGGSSPIQEDSLSSCPSLPEVYTLPVRDRPNCPTLHDGAGKNLKYLSCSSNSYLASDPSKQRCSPALNSLGVCCLNYWCRSTKGLKLSAQPEGLDSLLNLSEVETMGCDSFASGQGAGHMQRWYLRKLGWNMGILCI